MKNYKVINLRTNKHYILNQKEKDQFFKMNNKNDSYYIAIELKQSKLTENVQIFLFCIVAAALTFTSFALYLQLNY
jgi:hypothetical protein